MNNTYDFQKIGNRIFEERKKANLSQVELAGEIGIARQTLSKWERGEAVNPGIDALIKLCKVFDCEMGYLMCEYDCKTRIAADIHEETGLDEKAIMELHKSTRFLDENEIPKDENEDNVYSDPRIWKEICDDDRERKTQFLQFLNAFIYSKELRYIISDLCKLTHNTEMDNYYPTISRGECWTIQNQFNNFIERYSGIEEAREKYEKSKEDW